MLAKQLFLVLSILALPYVSNSQDWHEGEIKLINDSITRKGQFDIAHFAHLSAIRHLTDEETQNTFPTSAVECLKIYPTKEERDSILFRSVSFKMPKRELESKILLQVLYSSDSISLLQGDIRAIKKFFTAYPWITPAGPAMAADWGKKVKRYDMLLMKKGDFSSLHVVGEIKKDFLQKDLQVKVKYILRELMHDFSMEVKSFVKKNKLDWYQVDDLIKITDYYQSLKRVKNPDLQD